MAMELIKTDKYITKCPCGEYVTIRVYAYENREGEKTRFLAYCKCGRIYYADAEY